MEKIFKEQVEAMTPAEVYQALELQLPVTANGLLNPVLAGMDPGLTTREVWKKLLPLFAPDKTLGILDPIKFPHAQTIARKFTEVTQLLNQFK